MSFKDGGPAFPSVGPFANSGMSLRDYFAAKAMGSIGEDVHSVVYHAQQVDNHAQAEHAATVIATAAYLIADAMLKAREA